MNSYIGTKLVKQDGRVQVWVFCPSQDSQTRDPTRKCLEHSEIKNPANNYFPKSLSLCIISSEDRARGEQLKDNMFSVQTTESKLIPS